MGPMIDGADRLANLVVSPSRRQRVAAAAVADDERWTAAAGQAASYRASLAPPT